MTVDQTRTPGFVARALTMTLSLVALIPFAVTAQEAPAGWEMRLDRTDRGGPEDVSFVEMAPGWHVTTGPAVILYHPETMAAGEYRVESEIFLFDPGERREAFGFFIGGTDLDGEDQAYTYFLIRRTGEFLIKTRSGAETQVVQDWTAHDAVLSWEEKAADDATAKNVLAVEVGNTQVTFYANGQEVASIPRADVPTEGVVGLRVNHGLNLHVGSLEVTEVESDRD